MGILYLCGPNKTLVGQPQMHVPMSVLMHTIPVGGHSPGVWDEHGRWKGTRNPDVCKPCNIVIDGTIILLSTTAPHVPSEEHKGIIAACIAPHLRSNMPHKCLINVLYICPSVTRSFTYRRCHYSYPVTIVALWWIYLSVIMTIEIGKTPELLLRTASADEQTNC